MLEIEWTIVFLGSRVRKLRGVQIILIKSDIFNDEPKKESSQCRAMCLNECDEV